MTHPWQDLEDKENNLRKAIGLPPLPKWAWKREADYTDEDFKQYMEGIVAQSKRLYKIESSQQAYVEKERKEALKGAWWAVARRAKQRKGKLKTNDSVIVTDGQDVSSVTVNDIADLASKKTRDKAKKEKDPLSQVAPVLKDLVANSEDRYPRDSENLQTRTIGQKLETFQNEVFRRAFPILSKVIETFEQKKRTDSREKSQTALRESRALDSNKQTAVILESLSREQEKSVDLLRDLLDAVKQLSRSGRRLDIPSPGFRRLRGSVRALRKALPFLLGAAAAAGGAYSSLTSATDRAQRRLPSKPAPQSEREDPKSTGGIIPPTNPVSQAPASSMTTPIPTAPGTTAGTDYPQGTRTEGVTNRSSPLTRPSVADQGGPSSAPREPTAERFRTPFIPSSPGSTQEGPNVNTAEIERVSRDLALRATRVVLRGNEIRVAGADRSQTVANPMSQLTSAADTADSRSAGGLSSASGGDGDVAQKVEKVEEDSNKDAFITGGLNDLVRDGATVGAPDSAQTRETAVAVRIPNNERETAAVVESSEGSDADLISRSIPEQTRPSLEGNSIGPAAVPVSYMGGIGAAVMGASQENAMAERTPVPPAVITSGASETGIASPGLEVPSSVQDPNDPGNVEPDDAAERYAKLFNMAA